MNFTLKCFKCGKVLPESEMHLSHDIPKYLGGTDKDGRHYLCPDHHFDYEIRILCECLKSIGEELIEGEEMQLMIALSKQPEELKIKFREIAQKIRERFYGNSNTT